MRSALAATLPEPRCELDHRNAFELLVATILSAQTTDRGVNKVTPTLFARFPEAAAMAAAELAELEAIVRPTGFFKTKAKHIRDAARLLVERHGGEVPRTVEELTALPGVARKTANVVLGTGFGIASGITVDTHARRVSQRLGLTAEEDPVRIEAALCALVPRDEWIAFSHRLVLHGRYTCIARAPRCEGCACAPSCAHRARAERSVGGREA